MKLPHLIAGALALAGAAYFATADNSKSSVFSRAGAKSVSVTTRKVESEPKSLTEMVFDLAVQTAAHLGTGVSIERETVRANCDYVGDGYGLPTDGMRTAVKMLAEVEGLLFDPVYSGKGLDGMIDLIRKGHFDGMENIVFLHTGGSAALFGYPETFDLPEYVN